MAIQPEAHAKSLLEESRLNAEQVVDQLLRQEALRVDSADQVRFALVAEIDHFHMFLIFSALRDPKHIRSSYYIRVDESLKKLFTDSFEASLGKLQRELRLVQGGDELWNGLQVSKDPFAPYYGSFDGGCKTLTDSPFGVLARRLSKRYFPKDRENAAFETVLSLSVDSGDRITECVDKPPH